MKIFIIGGTGLVGSYLIPKLIENKHKVYALTRESNKLIKIHQMNAVPILGDITDPSSYSDLFVPKCDIIVLLAMPSIKPGKRISKKIKKRMRIEVNSFFQNSMELAKKWQAPIILPGGTSYQTNENEIADETWPILRSGLTEIGADTDKMVNDAIQNINPQVIQLIYGKIYGNGGLFRFMFERMVKGKFRILGKGDNYIPNIHADDAALAVLKAIEKMPIGEKFIIADNTPVTLKVFHYHMAELMQSRRPRHIPPFIIKLILGKDLYQVVSMNCRVSNEKARKLLDWEPKYPSYKEGLVHAIKEMKECRPYFEID
jgi:nucleoside-diphosphate-sugar epimerase